MKRADLFRYIALLLIPCLVCPALGETVTENFSAEDPVTLAPAPTGQAGVSPAAADTEKIEAHIFELVNEERAKRTNWTNKTYPLLRRTANLDRLAERHSTHMARRNALFHAMPAGVWGQNVAIMGPGNLKFPRCSGSGPVYHHVDDNPGDIANATMDLFMKHDCKSGWGHKGNILTRRYRTIGVGVVYARGVYWITQDFGY